MPYVDNAPIAAEPKTPQELRDERQERDQAEYDALYSEVLEEHWSFLFGWEIEAGHRPDTERVHEEVMRRLKEKYEQ